MDTMMFKTFAVERDFRESKIGLFNFGIIEINSDAFDGGILISKVVLLQVEESILDKRGNMV